MVDILAGTEIAISAHMKRYRLIEVGCSRELYAIAADDTTVRDDRTVARFTVPDGEPPAWLERPLRAFHTRDHTALNVPVTPSITT